MKQKNNIWEVFRGIAALLVMFHHYTERYDSVVGHLGNWPVQSLYGGQFGVCMFFIFTGMFLMPSLIKSENYAKYLIKRANRLYPYYIPCVIITYVCMVSTPPHHPLSSRVSSFGDFVVNLTMFQSYLGYNHVDGAYWTLAVQLIVYILMGGLFFILKKNIKHFISTVILWFGLDVLLSLYSIQGEVVPCQSLLIMTVIHLFVQGLLIWFITVEKNRKERILALSILVISPLYSLFNFSMYYTIFNFCLISIIYWVSVKKWDYNKSNIFTFLGSISFPMYLLHQNIGFLIIRYMETIGLTQEIFIFIPILIIILLSWGVTFFVEQYIIPLLCKIEKRELRLF